MPSASSEYENYGRTSHDYDQTRLPIGIEVLIGALSSSPWPLSEQRVLDAGCGTGNYLAALNPLVSSMVGFDQNEGMLAQAKSKVTASGATFVQGQLPELPFENDSFNAVVCNQVVHHFDSANGFAQLKALFAEVNRVLRPGGVFSLNTCSEVQLDKGYWYYDLIAPAAERIKARYMPMDELVAGLKGVGFQQIKRFVPTDEVLQGDAYFDLTGPLHAQWRSGDSTFALLSGEELEQSLRRITTMAEDGSLERHFAVSEQRRKEVGQCTFVLARKPAALTAV